MSSFAQRLDRVLQRMNATKVARRLGVDPSTISQWRRGKRSPDPDTIARLCSILGVSPEDLLHDQALPEAAGVAEPPPVEYNRKLFEVAVYDDRVVVRDGSTTRTYRRDDD